MHGTPDLQDSLVPPQPAGPPGTWARRARRWGPLVGAALALHLVTCASRTLGYGLRFEPAIFACMTSDAATGVP